FKGTVTATAASFASLTGGFSISKAADRLTVAAAGVTAFVGAGDTGFGVTNGSLGVVVDINSKKFALVANGTASLSGIAGVSVSGSGSVRLNRLGVPVLETISTPAGDVALNFPSNDDVTQLSGSITLDVSGFVGISATIAVEKTTTASSTTLIVQASAVTAFLGTGADTVDTSDDMGVRLKNGSMDLRIQKDTASGLSTYAFAARGTAELVGISAISLSGTVVAQKSTLANAVVLDFGTTQTTDDVTVLPGSTQFGGSLALAIAGFTTLSGNIGFEQQTVGSVTKIKVAATEVQAFLGSNPDNLAASGDEVGAQISNARLGAVFYRSAAGNSYALD
ncbi:MAG TPA: hypothetical protein DIT89_08415, partial [Planctomycetaceae bacterium]|nr:hypothetical protein [Planctomycetaceae bacterium]